MQAFFLTFLNDFTNFPIYFLLPLFFPGESNWASDISCDTIIFVDKSLHNLGLYHYI